MKSAEFKSYLSRAVDLIGEWEGSYGDFRRHPSLEIEPAELSAALGEYATRLKDNYPFFHPRYAGQMLKPPHPAAVIGYLAAMLINPNNHALDGGPATGQMEKEVVSDLSKMFHIPDPSLGHLTSSGTIANLEALWVARSIHPYKAVAFSEDAHYTHSRMSEVLGLPTVQIPTDEFGRLRVDILEEKIKEGNIGTVVATAGTTGLGVVDPISDILALRSRYDFRVHIDAAYGGFFSLLAWGNNEIMTGDTVRHLRGIGACDSVAVDPHKHGLQPYGCGCIIFRDPEVGKFYRHDSPYTYFTSEELHLGEISLECSRAGAAAGALWLTLKLLPLEAESGLGAILSATIRAARKWSALIEASEAFKLYIHPELDILTFYPAAEHNSASEIDRKSQGLFRQAMESVDDPVFLSVLRVSSRNMEWRVPNFISDQAQVRILRSVLMKPEHEDYVPHLHGRLLELV